MGIPVNRPGDVAAALATKHFSNPSTTRQRVLLPTGAKWVALTYKLLPGATATAGQYLKVCLNAASDDHATNMLALDGMHMQVYQGEDITMPAADVPITRVDFVTAQAVGTEVTSLRVVAGV